VKGSFGNSAKRNFAAVARGTYDWTPDFPLGVDVRALVRTRAAQVHPLLLSGLHFFFLNTQEPPFDDVRVRRAVNFAVDRNAVIEAVGGDLRASPSCQVVPPTLFGYRPYCPYTAHPDPTGTWKAPDLQEGRRLVRAAGAEGARVRVLTRPDHPELGPIMVQAMNAIGLRASVQAFPAHGEATQQLYYEYGGDSRNHVAVGFFGWGVDFPEPSNMFTPLLRCSAAAQRSKQNTNAAFFCDHALDAQMDRAAALQSTDPAAAAREWATLDRKVTDLAPWVFLYNDRLLDLVSERVGNYQPHPEFGMLLSQVWVR
jgi:peptide/nickel transport system substrate-binding protein